MLTKLLIAVVPVGIILILSEILWRRKVLKGERARKFIHILGGVWIAFWPFYVPFDGIFVLGCASLTLLIYSRFTRLFHAIYEVKRTTYGDILYAVAIVACAYFGQRDWIFTVSILLLALADGGAAVAGRTWGKDNTYTLFGNRDLRKSVIGTATFLLLAFVCVTIGWLLGGSEDVSGSVFAVFFLLPILTTILENIMPYGLDNLATPLFATLLLNSLL